VVATLTVLELPNLFTLLDTVQRAGDAEATIALATSLYGLLQNAGRPRLVERVGEVRDAAAAALGETRNHARFLAQRTRIEQQLAAGRLHEAFDGARDLLEHARAAGEKAYPGADYDLAVGCLVLSRALVSANRPEQALPMLEEAQQRFEVVERNRPGGGAERMAGLCISERGQCLLKLGQLDAAAAVYEESIREREQRGDERGVAVNKSNLGAVHLEQRRYAEALEVFKDALERFTALGELGTVAGIWYQTGRVYQRAEQPEAAEDAYKRSLAIAIRLNDVVGKAATLSALGNLYDDELDRPEEAVVFQQQAADSYVELRDAASEGLTRNNLADTLCNLRRLDEARQEITRAIECDAQVGHAAEPWKTWNVLAKIETNAGNPAEAAEATRKAVAAYYAYRRDGGENHDVDGRLCLAVSKVLGSGDAAAAMAQLQQLSADARLPNALHPLVDALRAIVAGSRDRSLADAPNLHYRMAAEVLLLIETLG